MRKVLAAVAVALCVAGCASRDDLEVARANAAKALIEASALRSQVDRLENRVDELESAIQNMALEAG